MSFGVIAKPPAPGPIAKTPDALQQINQITNGPLTYNSQRRFAIQCQDENSNKVDCPSDIKDYLPKMDDVYEYFSEKGYPEPRIRTIRIIDSGSLTDTLIPANILDYVLDRKHPYLINYSPGSRECNGRDGGYNSATNTFVICNSTDFLNTFVHEYFHSLQYALTKKENGSTPTSEWILEGSATAVAKTYEDRALFPSRLVRDSRYNPPPLDKALMAFPYAAQDFFVFAGQKTGTHVEELKHLFSDKSLYKGLDAGLFKTTYGGYGLKGMYFQYVRNEAYEKKVQITSGPSITNSCTPSEDRFVEGIPEYSSFNNQVRFKLPPMSSRMVKVSFVDFGNSGQGGSIHFNATVPSGFRYIVYKEGEDGCEDKKGTINYSFDGLESGATHNFYILMSNTNHEPSSTRGPHGYPPITVKWEETHY